MANLASKGRGGDTEIRKVDGRPSHVNAHEAYLIDTFGKIGEDFATTYGSGTINPETGLPEYGLGSILGQASSAASAYGSFGATAAGGAGTLAGAGAMAAAAPFLGIAAVGAGIYDWVSGAGDEAKANREKQKKLKEGISQIENQRSDYAENTLSDINSLWEGLGRGLDQLGNKAGEQFGEISSRIGNVIKKGKGLATGSAEIAQETLTDSVTSQFEFQRDELLSSTDKNVNQLTRSHTSQMQDIAFSIKDMEDQIKEAEKNDTTWEAMW